MRRPTLAKVAECAGVSTMTVSRVVRGLDGVSPETTKRVRYWIGKLDYRPDPLLGALAARRSGRQRQTLSVSLAVVTPGDDLEAWHSVVNFRENVAGVEKETARLGYGLESCAAGMTPASWEKTLKMLYARGVRGLVIPPVHILIPPEIDFQQFSGVNLGFGRRASGFHTIRHDLYQMTSLALGELVQRGYRRIGVVTTRDEDRSGHRISGAALALNRPGCGPCAGRVRPPLLLAEIPSRFTDASRKVFLQWIKRECPDVIIGLQTQVYTSWLKAAGIRVPEDIAVVILNMSRKASGPHPQFAGVGISNEQVGTIAVEMLHSMIQRGETGRADPRQLVLLDGEWIDGPSVPATRISDPPAAAQTARSSPGPRSPRG